jgi:hypothetical protein
MHAPDQRNVLRGPCQRVSEPGGGVRRRPGPGVAPAFRPLPEPCPGARQTQHRPAASGLTRCVCVGGDEDEDGARGAWCGRQGKRRRQGSTWNMAASTRRSRRRPMHRPWYCGSTPKKRTAPRAPSTCPGHTEGENKWSFAHSKGWQPVPRRSCGRRRRWSSSRRPGPRRLPRPGGRWAPPPAPSGTTGPRPRLPRPRSSTPARRGTPRPRRIRRRTRPPAPGGPGTRRRPSRRTKTPTLAR